MKIYYLQIPLILSLLIFGFINYNAHAETETAVSLDSCTMPLLDHKDALSSFFEAVEQENTDKLLSLKDMTWDSKTGYQNRQIIFHYASFLGKANLMETLVSELGIDVNIQDPKNGQTALHYASLNKDILSRINTIYTLFKLGASFDNLHHLKAQSNMTDEEEQTPINYTLDHKAKAVELAMSTNTQQIATLLQINYKDLYGWVRQSPELKAKVIERVINGSENAAKVARDIGAPQRTVSGWVRDHKKENGLELPKPKPRYPADLRNEAIQRVIENNETITEVAKKLGAKEGAVSYWVRRHREKNGLIKRKPYPPDLKNKAIYKVTQDKRSVKQVAKDLNIHERALQRWLHQLKSKDDPSLKPKKKHPDYPSELKVEASERVIKGQESVTKVAKDIGVPKLRVSRWVRMSPYFPEFKDRAIQRVIKEGMSLTKAAEELGIDRHTLFVWVLQYKVKNGLEIPKPKQYTPEVKALAVNMFLSGISRAKVAKHFGVNKHTISSWAKNHRKSKETFSEDVPQELIEEAVDMVVEDGADLIEVSKIMEIDEQVLTDAVQRRK